MRTGQTTILLSWVCAIYLFELATWGPVQAHFVRGVSSKTTSTHTFTDSSGALHTVRSHKFACGVRDETPQWLAYLYTPVTLVDRGPVRPWFQAYESWWRRRLK